MSLELVYTSAPRGLSTTASGFCTVAATAGVSRQVTTRLEALSGYQFHFNLSDPQANLNPVNFAHTRVRVGAETFSVLSRVAFCGADYSGRTNKIAHHILLEKGEPMPNGPAWMMMAMARGVFIAGWNSEPQNLPKRSVRTMIADAPRPADPATTWEAVTGDAGWGGVLAKAFREDPKVPAFVIFSPGTELLPLFEESLALLPPEERWQVGFATYYTTLPAGCHYHWRGILAGSPAAREIARFPSAAVIDLTAALGRAADNEFTEAARSGKVVQPARKPERPPVRVVDQPEPVSAGAAADSAAEWWDEELPRPELSTDLLAEAAQGSAIRRTVPRRSWKVPALVAAVILLAISNAVFMGLYLSRQPLLPDSPGEPQASDAASQPPQAPVPEPGKAPQPPAEKPGNQTQQAGTSTDQEGAKEGKSPAEGSLPGGAPKDANGSKQTGAGGPPAPSPPPPKAEADRQPSIQIDPKPREEVVAPGRQPVLAEVQKRDGTWEFDIGTGSEFTFLSFPEALRKELTWGVGIQLTDEAQDVAAKVECPALHGLGRSATLLTCRVRKRQGRCHLLCEADETTWKAEPYGKYYTWLALEVMDETNTVYQCVFGKPKTVEQRVRFGYNDAGRPEPDPKPVSLTYPWPATLRLLCGGDSPALLSIPRHRLRDSVPVPQEGNGKGPKIIHVELSVEAKRTKDAGGNEKIELVPKLETLATINNLVGTKLDQWRGHESERVAAEKGMKNAKDNRDKTDKEKNLADWTRHDDSYNTEQKRRDYALGQEKALGKPIEDLIRAVAQFLAGRKTLEARDAWGFPIVRLKLEFGECPAENIIKKYSESTR